MGLIPDSGDSAKRKCFPAGWNVFPKPCDYCKYAAALLFCSADSAFMCISCDSEVHHYDGNMTAVRHGKVWMCEVCEQAPAAVTCRADNASLCFTCDRDIHSANPLAQRHERAAVVPFYDSAESVMLKSAAGIFSGQDSDEISDGYIPDSWISTDSISTSKLPAAADAPEMKSMEFLLPDYDRFLDCNRFQICSQPYSDSVVPVQTTVEPPLSAQLTHQHSPENQFEIDFTRSSITSYNNSYTSLSHRVPSASIDVGVVPEGSAFVSETSYPFSASSISDPIANHGFPAAGMDREARVLRYREKRKNRKFAKTIRYASRKAYAERRPRIKGRFVKRTDPESDMDEILSIVSGNLIADTCYGVVPSS